MDRVRLGRALGYGARHAGKSLLEALDAATSPDPKAAARPQAAPERVRQAGGVVQAGQQATRSVLAPVKKATSVVLLQVTGSFFALLALGMGRGAWRLKDGLHAGVLSTPWMEFWLVTALTLGLAYFAVSNFVRAARRDRG